MDNLLLRLLNVRHEQERQQCLDELLTLHVAPIVRQVLRLRLGLYVNARGVNENNHDAQDLYQEAMTRIIEVLHSDQRSLASIENFERYVGRIVSNVCVDFLRSKYPARARLKDGLRDVFRRHGDLVSWQHGDEILCGFAVWRNSGKPAVSDHDVEAKMNAFLADRFADQDVRGLPLSRVVTELLDWTGGPVQIDVLVRMLAYVRGIREQEIESWDDHVAADFELKFCRSTRSVGVDVETNEMLGRLWRIVKRLPPNQRDAFALRFHDDAGRDLFTVLLAARIVDWKNLAAGLERSVADLARLWSQMPMDSATAANELRTSRENVYKWKFRAIQTLKAELK
jgi:RNA polymerase sigma factor (sigma-70 family)